MVLHVLCMNTNTNTYLLGWMWPKKLVHCELVAKIFPPKLLSIMFRYKFEFEIFSVGLSRLDFGSISAQANNIHSIARRPFRGNPQPSRTPPQRCYLPPPRPQTYRLQGFEVVLFQGFQVVLFLLLHGLQAAPPSAGLPRDLISPDALQRFLISCLTYSSAYFLLIHYESL